MTYDIVNVRSNPAQWMAWQQSVFSDWELLRALDADADFREALGIQLPNPAGYKGAITGRPGLMLGASDKLDSYRNLVEATAAPVTAQASRSGMDWLAAHVDALEMLGETVAIFGSGRDTDHQIAVGGQIPIRDWVRMQHCMMVIPWAKEYHYWSWNPHDRESRVLLQAKPDKRFQLRLLNAEKALYERHRKHAYKADLPAEMV